MALNALTLSVSSGVQGRAFKSAVSGATAGNIVEVLPGGSPGFGFSNGFLKNEGLSYDTNLAVLRERNPVTGESLTTRLIITAVSEYALKQQAAAIDATFRTVRPAPVQKGDGSLAWNLFVESASGATSIAGIGSVSLFGQPGLATIGTVYSFIPTASGGQGAKTFAYTGTTLATYGLAFNTSTGAITGTVSGSPTLISGTITVTDGSGNAPLPVLIGVFAALGPTTASFLTAAAAGTAIATFTGLGSGETVVTVAPNDGRIAIGGAGTTALVGLSASSSGTTNYTFTTSAGRALTVAVSASTAATLNAVIPNTVEYTSNLAATDGTALHGFDGWTAQTPASGKVIISGGNLVQPSSGSTNYVHATSSPNFNLKMTVRTNGGNSSQESRIVYVMNSATANVTLNYTTNGIILSKFVNPTNTQLAGAFTAETSCADGDVVELKQVRTGSSKYIQVWKNGVHLSITSALNGGLGADISDVPDASSFAFSTNFNPAAFPATVNGGFRTSINPSNRTFITNITEVNAAGAPGQSTLNVTGSFGGTVTQLEYAITDATDHIIQNWVNTSGISGSTFAFTTGAMPTSTNGKSVVVYVRDKADTNSIHSFTLALAPFATIAPLRLGMQDANYGPTALSDFSRNKMYQGQWTAPGAITLTPKTGGLAGHYDWDGTINQYPSGNVAEFSIPNFYAATGTYTLSYPAGFTLTSHLSTGSLGAPYTVSSGIEGRKITVSSNTGAAGYITFSGIPSGKTATTLGLNVSMTLDGDATPSLLVSDAFVSSNTTMGTAIWRMMDARPTNNNLGLYDGRPSASGLGFTIPHMVEACNRTPMDPWLNFYINQTDASIQAEMAYVAANLDAARNFFIEYGNENWNFGFTQWPEVALNGMEAGFHTTAVSTSGTSPVGPIARMADPANFTITSSGTVATPARSFTTGEYAGGNLQGAGCWVWKALQPITSGDSAAVLPTATNAYWEVSFKDNVTAIARQRWCSYRTQKLAQFAVAAFTAAGRDTSKIIPVFAWQSVAAVSDQSYALEFDNGLSVFKRYAVAPYWNSTLGSYAGSIGAWNPTAKAKYTTDLPATLDAYFDATASDVVIDAEVDLYRTRKSELAAYLVGKGLSYDQITLCAYEGGNHATFGGDWTNNSARLAMQSAMQADARYGKNITRYLEGIRTKVGGEFLFYARKHTWPWNIIDNELDRTSPAFVAAKAVATGIAPAYPTPTNSAAPVITGTAQEGQVVSVSNGTWANATAYEYQWYRNYGAISGSINSTRTLTSADVGAILTCSVKAKNAGAYAAVTTAATSAVIAAAAPLPVNTTAPAVTGSTVNGSTLTTDNGTWTNSPTTYAYQWRRNGVDISGATSSTYVTVTADGGTSVTCRVSATNAGGTTPAVSNAIAIAAVLPWMSIATATYFPNSVTAANTAATSMTRKAHKMRDSFTSLKFAYVTAQSSTNNGETLTGADLPFQGWVEASPGVYTPITFAGNANPTLSDGAISVSDAIAVSGNAGDTIYTWSRAACTSSGRIPLCTNGLTSGFLNAAQGEGSTTTSAPSAPSSTVPSSTTAGYMVPVAIIAQTSTSSAFICGDSRVIAFQVNATPASLDRGHLAGVIGPSMAYCNAGTSGDTTSGALSGKLKAQVAKQFFTHVVDEFATNDMYVNLGTLAAVKTLKQRWRGRFNGMKYLRTTIEPNTGGDQTTDDLSTTNGQTTNTVNSIFLTWNQFVQGDGVPYLEVATGAKNSQDSLYWKANYSSDGLHANSVGTPGIMAWGNGAGAWVSAMNAAPVSTYTWAPTMTAGTGTNGPPVYDTTDFKFGTASMRGGSLNAWEVGPMGGGEWTVMLWAKHLSTSTKVAHTLTGSQTNWNITVSVAGVLSASSAGRTSVTASSGAGLNVYDDLWHHYALVSTRTGFSLYLDGVLVGTTTAASSSLNPMTRAMGIGNVGIALTTARVSASDVTKLDEWSHWNYAMNSTQVAAEAAASSAHTGLEAGLVALLHLDDATVIAGSGA